MTVDAGEFINKLRERLALKLDEGMHGGDILGAFDRSCVQVLVEEHQGQKELTSGQKAARTRAKNRQTRQAVTGNSAQQSNSLDKNEAVGE
jgi:hypothetical protein